MKIELLHDKLNLFQSFGGDCANENNYTRALLIALSRSAWSPMLLRAFLDLVCEKLGVRGQGHGYRPFFSRWPESVEFAMQRGVADGSFLAPDVTHSLLVELTPLQEQGGEPCLPDDIVAQGIVDAVVLIRTEEGALAVVIESKLYGRVGEEQMQRYLLAQHFGGLLSRVA